MTASYHSLSSKPSLLSLLFLLWIFSSTAFAASAVLGVDFGTEYIKAALVKPGIPLEIVLTKDSRRKEASAVAFKPLSNPQSDLFPERVYGSDALALAPRFPADVYPNIKALLGLPADNPKVKEYAARYPALKLEADKIRGTTAFRSSALGEQDDAWLVEELLAMELKSIQRNAEALAGKGSSIKDIVITVPPYFGAEEKRAIELAADLAGLRVLSLISDGLAVGLNYATSRTFPSVTDGAKPEHHLVFDMGAGSTSATVLKFQARSVKDVGKFNKTIQEVRVLGTGWDRTLGGDVLNSIIVEDMVEKFVLSKGAKAASITAESVKSHGRAAAKLWKESERLRQVLSANTETQASFEGLYEDVDFRYKLSRADFEKLTESFAERVKPAIDTALDRANLEIGEIDSIILHGGAARTPFIQKQLEKIVGSSEKLRSNVNADEAAVFGAAFKGATLSPSFRVKEIRTYDVAGYAVGLKWRNIHDKPQHQPLYLPQSQLGTEKVVSFQNQEDFAITFYQHIPSSEEVSTGSAEKEIALVTTLNLTASIAEAKDKHGCSDGDILAKFGVRLNVEHGEVEITKASLHCELEEDDKKGSVVDGVKGLFGFGSKKSDQDVFQDADIVSDVTSSSDTSSSSSTSTSTSSSSTSSAPVKSDTPKVTKRLIAIPLAFNVTKRGYPELPREKLVIKKERLLSYDDSDRSRRLREEALNQLEAFTYRARDLVDDAGFVAASTNAERTSLEQKAKAASEWLYGEGADASREQLKEKLKELKDIVNPVEKRKDEASKRPEQIKLLQDALNSTKSFIDMVKEQINKAAESSSSATTETTSTTTASESPVVDNEFEGLEDEETTTSTSTSSSKIAKPTPPAPLYTLEDLEAVTSVHLAVSEWFEAKLEEQEKLDATADPVLLVKDLAAKAQELNKAGTEMLMKAMRGAEPPKRSSSRKSSSKSKKTKSTKSATAGTKSASAEEAQATIDLDDVEKPNVKEAEDVEVPTEEEILEAIKAKQAGEDKKSHVVDEL